MKDQLDTESIERLKLTLRDIKESKLEVRKYYEILIKEMLGLWVRKNKQKNKLQLNKT